MARKKVVDELLDHDYDGIQELDNDLPPWWTNLFYFTIVFAVVYMAHYHILGTGPSSSAEYENEMAAAEAKYAAVIEQSVTSGPVEALTDEASLTEGKNIYTVNCVPCHGTQGEGGIGPTLADKYWLHGGQFSDIIGVINNGVPEKGMISWKPILNPSQIQQVASYLLTFQGTTPPNMKEPQGELVEN